MLEQRSEGPEPWLLPPAVAARMEIVPARDNREAGWAEIALAPGEALWTIMQAGGSIQLNGPGE
eukprot:7023757-Prorocentrum_lima.AAC.1